MKKTESQAEPAFTYTKQQFLQSRQYTGQQKDLLDALLVEGEAYTIAQVTQLMDDFLNREVG